MPSIRLVLIDSDLNPYLAVLLVADLYKAGDMIRVPSKGNVVLAHGKGI